MLIGSKACRILVSQAGIKPISLQWKHSPNHWTTRKIPIYLFIYYNVRWVSQWLNKSSGSCILFYYFSLFFWPHCVACGILALWPKIKHWKDQVSTTELPGKHPSAAFSLWLWNFVEMQTLGDTWSAYWEGVIILQAVSEKSILGVGSKRGDRVLSAEGKRVGSLQVLPLGALSCRWHLG